MHGERFEAFADALARGHDDLDEHREALRSVVDDETFIEAAAVAAVFHGYVRVADGTGIPVEELVVATSGELRAELGIDAYQGRHASDLAVPERPAADFTPSLET